MRSVLSQSEISPDALVTIERFNPEAIDDAIKAIKTHEWVIIGMSGNPFVKKARKHLASKNKTFHYIEHGSYFSKWKVRLAIKLWSGWATFPQVFHNGKLIGGANDLLKYLP